MKTPEKSRFSKLVAYLLDPQGRKTRVGRSTSPNCISKSFRTGTAALLFCFLLGVGGTPAVSAAGDQGSDVERIEKSLQWQQGEITIGDNLVRLNVPPTFRFLGPKDASAVLTSVWGNPPSKVNILGMIFPAAIEPSNRSSWGVVITYEADGYVKDNEAATINYNDLLKQLQEAMEAQNNQRTKAGYPAIHLVGWAARTHYNRDTSENAGITKLTGHGR